MKILFATLALFAMAFSALIFAGASRAESPVTFSGFIELNRYDHGGYFNVTDYLPKADDLGDHYFSTRLRLNVSFKPTDYLEIKWRLHAPHAQRWGTGTAQLTPSTRYIYGIVTTAIGKFSAGRISYDLNSAGLQTLGYLPYWGMNAQFNPFDVDSEDDGIMYRNDWDNGFGLKAFYLKDASESDVKDGDYDRYSIEPYYKWEGGGASFAVQYDRNMTNDVIENYYVSVNPAIVHSFAVGEGTSLGFHAEAKYSVGKRRDTAASDEYTIDGLGVYADLALMYPSGDVTLSGWWFNGNEEGDPASHVTGGGTRHDLVDGGEGFYPFVVFYLGHYHDAGYFNHNSYMQPNHWGVALLGNHRFTEKINFNWSVGTFQRVKDYFNAEDKAISKNMGTEADLGLDVTLMDNLYFNSKVGVFAPGDYYQQRYPTASISDLVWAWGNRLTYTF
ncbi:MAG: hypothetical protein LBF41_00900 [Deltaproteobacteria bacterium]|nr:hypothetical protein [Deltaproteobacteria bacterium]